MSRKSLLSIAFVMMLISTAAVADGGADIFPMLNVDLPPEIADCIRACQSNDPCLIDPSGCQGNGQKPDPKVQKQIDEINAAYRALKGQVAKLQNRVSALEKQGGLLGKDVQDELASLKLDLAKLAQGNEAGHQSLIKDLLQAVNKVVKERERIDALVEDVASLIERVNDFERSNIRVAPQIGGLYLATNDGTRFSAGSLGARFVLKLTSSVEIDLDASVLLSVSDRPAGTSVRAGIGWYFMENLGIEAGVSGMFAGLNDQLESQSVFVNGDVGLALRFGRFTAGASFLVGTEFDKGESASAFGGALRLGWEFP